MSGYVIGNVSFVDNTFIIDGSSSYGCPTLQLSALSQFFEDNLVPCAIVLMALGIFECFFGYKILKPTLFLGGYITGFAFLIIILGQFIA